MVVAKDFAVSAEDVRWVDRENLIEVTPGLLFRTPEHFYEHTLCVFINGNKVERLDDIGYTIIDDETFKMRMALAYPQFSISVFYVMKEV